MPCMLEYMPGCYFKYSIILYLNYYYYFLDETYFLSESKSDSLS